MVWSSSGPEYLKRTRCRVISAKYAFASFEVDVPKPEKEFYRLHKTLIKLICAPRFGPGQ